VFPVAEMTVAEVCRALPEHRVDEATLRLLGSDRRLGVRRLGKRVERVKLQRRREKQRLQVLYANEARFRYGGCQLIAGVDEAGRGPLAGPVLAAAVILLPGRMIEGIDDSKRLSDERRRDLAKEIQRNALAVGMASVGPAEIDRMNIRAASLLAMRRAVQDLGVRPDLCLVDGTATIDVPCRCIPVVGGDRRIAGIASASILAKVARDDIMIELDRLFPAYGFAVNKGYPTAHHRDALQRFGPCIQHRRTFRGVPEGWPERSTGS